MKQEQYLNNREQRLSVISKNMGMYKQLPGNMVTGIADNFKTTFNKENFLNYWNPNTSYNELKDYSKSAIQTGVTVYGGVKIAKYAFNKATQVYKEIQINKLINNKSVNLSSEMRTKHILYGDETGGGHMWPGNEGKTAFPKGWNGNKIMNEVSDIITDPSLEWKIGRTIKGVTRYEVIGVRNGVIIKVVTDGKDIITAFSIK